MVHRENKKKLYKESISKSYTPNNSASSGQHYVLFLVIKPASDLRWLMFSFIPVHSQNNIASTNYITLIKSELTDESNVAENSLKLDSVGPSSMSG